MKIVPSLDIKNGLCVGRDSVDQQTVYSEEPLAVAEQFAAMGAEYLHIADLDGAQSAGIGIGSPNLEIIKQIADIDGLSVQCGGGIRDQNNIIELFSAGAERVVIGTQAILQPKTVKKWFDKWGVEKIVLGFDVRFQDEVPYITSSGRQITEDITLWKALDNYPRDAYLLCTDIDRDGLLTSPNFSLYSQIREKKPQINIQAAGGVATFEDLQTLREHDIAMAVVGRAFYEEKINLFEALSIG